MKYTENDNSNYGWISKIIVLALLVVAIITIKANNTDGNTRTIVLTDEFSAPVHVDNTQSISYIISEGYASEYEVRDASNPSAKYKFCHGKMIITSKAPISDFQWRVSGSVVKGPVRLTYTVKKMVKN